MASTPNFEQVRAKGRELYDEMLAAAADDNPPAESYRSPADADLARDDMGDHLPGCFVREHDRVPLALLEGYRTPVALPRDDKHGAPYFENLVHESGRIIICTNNVSEGDPRYGTDGQYRWTQCMAFMYQDIVAAQNQHSLEQVWRVMINNQVTRSVIARARQRPPAVPSASPLILRAGEEGFLELLGSPNGKGVARMLKDYPRLFGSRVVCEGTIHFDDILCWHVGQLSTVEAPKKEPSPTLTRRRGRKQERQGRKRVTSGHFAGAPASTAS